MQTGTYISGVAHIGLVAWMIFGGSFKTEPLPFEVQEVSVISSADFAALTVPDQSPLISPDPVALPQPDAPVATPELSATPDPVPTPPETAQPEPDVPEVQPAPPAPPAPPVADIQPEPPAPEAPPEVAALPTAPRPTPRPTPQPAERVAPTPIAPPPPDTAVDDRVREDVAPDAGAETPQPEVEATAPEEAGTEIETEANEAPDQIALAPVQSLRPPLRPARPSAPRPETQTAQPAPEPEPEATQSDAVNAALAEALAGADASQPAASGPPLTQGEKDALRVAVQSCWNVGSLSSAALETTVVVAVEMTQDAKPVVASIRMLSSSGGTSASAQQAFEAARRAIIRCGASGFDLPAEKYASWRDIEMTFNPERMRIR